MKQQEKQLAIYFYELSMELRGEKQLFGHSPHLHKIQIPILWEVSYPSLNVIAMQEAEASEGVV